jgi:hypothetical protein
MVLPDPHPGLVIRYNYLWHDESMAGREEGVKNRPSVIVLSVVEEGKKRVLAVPITRQKPPDMSVAVEIPAATRKRLGLKDEPMWAICSEVNEFLWPGPDLIPTSRFPLRYEYGFLRSSVYEEIKAKINFCANGKNLKVVARTA